jgi:hypothetical protein
MVVELGNNIFASGHAKVESLKRRPTIRLAGFLIKELATLSAEHNTPEMIQMR